MEHKRYRGQRGPSKHFTEEARKKAIRESKTKYMLGKSWVCPSIFHIFEMVLIITMFLISKKR